MTCVLLLSFANHHTDWLVFILLHHEILNPQLIYIITFHQVEYVP